MKMTDISARNVARGLILSALLLATSTAARSSIEGRTYTNIDYGFQVTAPAGWSLERNIGSALVLVESPDGRLSFRVFVDLMSSLETPSDHRERARTRYGIRGTETGLQRLIETWEDKEPEYLPMPGERLPEREPVGELDDEILEGEEEESEIPPITEPEFRPQTAPTYVDDPDAGEVVVEEMTVMEGLIALLRTAGVAYKDPATRQRERDREKDQDEQLDDLAAILRELASTEPYITTYRHSVTDPVSGHTEETLHVVCYLLRNTVGYTVQASVSPDYFHFYLRDMIEIFSSMRIPSLEGGRYGRPDAIEMDPQTTGVITGRVLIRGTAVPGATISLYRTRQEYDERRPYKTTTSNFIGEFQLVGVPPGTYFLLRADATLGEESLATFQPPVNVSVRRGFASFVNLELSRVE